MIKPHSCLRREPPGQLSRDPSGNTPRFLRRGNGVDCIVLDCFFRATPRDEKGRHPEKTKNTQPNKRSFYPTII